MEIPLKIKNTGATQSSNSIFGYLSEENKNSNLKGGQRLYKRKSYSIPKHFSSFTFNKSVSGWVSDSVLLINSSHTHIKNKKTSNKQAKFLTLEEETEFKGPWRTSLTHPSLLRKMRGL